MVDRGMLNLIERQRRGWSLEQGFYRDPDIFDAERKGWFARQWFVVAHESEFPKVGAYVVRDLLGESIIIVRAGEGDFRGYYNVCTHRGSRLCEGDGRGKLFVCPYHAWSFRLTGELQSRQDLPDGADPDELGLHPVRTFAFGGVVMAGLGGDLLPDPRPAAEALSGAMERQGFRKARIVARKRYPTAANWKLVVENAFECYHCRPAHPEYFASNGHVCVTAVRDPEAAAQWAATSDAWRSNGDPAFNTGVREPGGLDRLTYGFVRQPIGGDRVSLSESGEAVGPLMGGFAERDGGETVFHFGRLSFASAANDYITLIQILPRGVEDTDMVLTWLVDADAPEEIDADAVSWMWDVTTIQDKKIIEVNAAGVASSAYRPGPYTALEAKTSEFVQTYLREMAELNGGGSDSKVHVLRQA